MAQVPEQAMLDLCVSDTVGGFMTAICCHNPTLAKERWGHMARAFQKWLVHLEAIGRGQIHSPSAIVPLPSSSQDVQRSAERGSETQ